MVGCDRRMMTNRERERAAAARKKKAAQEEGEMFEYLVRQYKKEEIDSSFTLEY